jgi:hypothetical protein
MKKLLFLTLLICGSSVQAQQLAAQDDPCELIVGDWQGTYRAGSSGFISEDYSFHGAYDENGVVMIDFTFFDGGGIDRHEGYWYCQNNVLTTALAGLGGSPILFQYRILDISPTKWRYQLLSTRPDAPVFEAQRIAPSSMTPQFLEGYPRSFFDALLPPGLRE